MRGKGSRVLCKFLISLLRIIFIWCISLLIHDSHFFVILYALLLKNNILWSLISIWQPRGYFKYVLYSHGCRYGDAARFHECTKPIFVPLGCQKNKSSWLKRSERVMFNENKKIMVLFLLVIWSLIFDGWNKEVIVQEDRFISYRNRDRQLEKQTQGIYRDILRQGELCEIWSISLH